MTGFRLAWRNLMRNPSRTRISLAAVALGTAVLIITYALTVGLTEELTRNIVDLGSGDVQVHAPSYLGERSLDDTLAEAPDVLAAAHAAGLSAAPRALGPAILAARDHTVGGELWGVDAAAERAVGDLPRHLRAGTFLDADDTKEIVLGAKLARLLRVDVGGHVAVIVQAADRSISTEMFEVKGILAPVSETLDTTAAIIGRDAFAEMLATGGSVHEIVLSSHGRSSSDEVAAMIAPSAGAADVRTWRKVAPAAAVAIDITLGWSAVIGFIFLLAAALGVLNAMLMASYERIPELGVIKALGATPGRIVADVAREALLLGLCGTVIGGALGVALSLVGQRYGIPLGKGVSISGVGLSVWHARLTPLSVVVPVVAMWLAAVAAAMYPAAKAARLDPIKAIAHA